MSILVLYLVRDYLQVVCGDSMEILILVFLFVMDLLDFFVCWVNKSALSNIDIYERHYIASKQNFFVVFVQSMF